jgi:hypothetical protein
MTRKQYRRKAMQLMRNINKYAKENGIKTSKRTDRIAVPNWNAMSEINGTPIRSYNQAWELLLKTFENCPHLLEGIK